MTLAQRYLRWRRSRGYGIHSPLAYRIVTQVLRPDKDTGYYGEKKLCEIARREALSRRLLQRASLILRFCAFLQPEYVWVTSKLPEIYLEAIRLSGSVIRIYDSALYPAEYSRSQLIITDRARLNAAQLKEIMGAETKALLAFDIDTKYLNRLINMNRGVMLEGSESLLMVSRPGLSAVTYSVSSF